jgi:hypothetical protein
MSHAAETDFLKHGSPGDGLFSIITNPPYNCAEAFIRKALDLTDRASGIWSRCYYAMNMTVRQAAETYSNERVSGSSSF